MYKMLLALAVVAVMACGAVAGEVSQAALSDMGLAGMQSMSDDEGMAVRGAWAFGGSFALAVTPAASSGSAYTAGDVGPGPDVALTSTYATATSTLSVYGPGGFFLGSLVANGTAYSAGIGIAGP